MNQLIKEKKYNINSDTLYAISYFYDVNGNRTLKTDLVTGDTSIYIYDSNDRLILEDTIVYGYDLNGNMIYKNDGINTTTYEYNYDNKMTKVLIGDDTQINYIYSGDGKLVSKIIGDSVIYYIYDGLNKIAELDGGDNELAKYSSGLMLDKPISQCRAGNYYYYHFDALGSVTELTDENENIKNIYRYNAFGEISVETETIKNDYKYTAREHESAIDLYHYRARFYNPVIGRFISKDPYPENYLYPLSFNRYIYTLNNPVIYTDPLGLYTKTWTRFKTKINTYYEKRNIVYTQRIKVFFFFWSCKGSYDYYKIKETTVTEIIYTLTISISPLDFEFNTETYIHPPKIEETFLGKKNNVSWTE